MTRKKSGDAPAPEQPRLRVSHDEADKRLAERIAIGQQLRSKDISTVEEISMAENERDRWHAYNTELLKQLFTSESFAEEYSFWGGGMVRMHPTPQLRVADLRDNLAQQTNRLQSIRERLELIPSNSAAKTELDLARTHTNKVFVVHGHDEGAKEAVARLLEKLGIEPVILHEQANEGRTLVEKLEYYANVDFAVVLLTPDDVGASKQEAQTKLQDRARQNVVLELGYFISRLGRSNVCALYKGPLELPSDYFGVVYVNLDTAGAWRLALVRELRSAGFEIDLNFAL